MAGDCPLRILFSPVICTRQQEPLSFQLPLMFRHRTDILLYRDTRLELDFYFILIDDLDTLNQSPDEVIIKLSLQGTNLFYAAVHSLCQLFVGFCQL